MYLIKLGYLWESEYCSEWERNYGWLIVILQSCVKVKHCILSFHQPTRSHVKPIYLAGGKAFFFSMRCGARGARGFWNVCLCSPGRVFCVWAFTVSRSTSGMHFNRWRFYLECWLPKSVLYAFVACYFNLFVWLIVCLFAYVLLFSGRIITGCADEKWSCNYVVNVAIGLSC